MQHFPIVDISPFAAGTPNAKQTLARDVDRICRRTGFLAIVGHGVSNEVIGKAWNAARLFFDLPLEKKLEVRMPQVDYPYGYAPLQSEILARSLGNETLPDLKESFSTGPLHRPLPFQVQSTDDAEAAFRFAPNLWPGEPAEFKESWAAYYRAMAELSATIMCIFAVALDLPAGFFEDKIDQHTSALRALNYPHLSETPTGSQLRAGAHSDYGSLTILLTESVPGGLEIYTPEDQWQPVPVVPGAFIVNIGDLMARWTNDRWTSTLHRVVCPPAGITGSTRRQSLAFFHQPNWSADISCIPTCLAPGDKAKYAPVRSGAHLMEKFRLAVSRT